LSCNRLASSRLPTEVAVVTGSILCCLYLLLSLVLEPECRHWFVVPVLLCGCIISGDAVEWIKGQRDLLDPVGLIGVFGLFFFFLAPLMHVSSDYWMRYTVNTPADWRQWLGLAASLNCVAVSLYRLTVAAAPKTRTWTGSIWVIDKNRFQTIALSFAVVSVLSEGYLYSRMGGMGGLVESYVTSLETQIDPLAGLGWLVVIAESFPTVAMMMALQAFKSRQKRPSLWVCLALLTGLFVAQFFFGGFRGSRANTVWPLVWAVGAIHLTSRRFGRISIAVGCVVIVGFLFVAGFYKEAGSDALLALDGSEEVERLSDRTGRTSTSMVLGDFGRADVQAYVIYRLLSGGADYEYALGRTYLGDILLLVPQALWPERVPAKSKWTTELEYGLNSFGSQRSSRIYGLLGEAMLNFGVFGAPGVFFLLGVAVAKVAKWIQSLHARDSRRLVAPYSILLCVLAVAFDVDNLLWIAVKQASVPWLIVLYASDRQRVYRSVSVTPFSNNRLVSNSV
jgi:hypothetical protein